MKENTKFDYFSIIESQKFSVIYKIWKFIFVSTAPLWIIYANECTTEIYDKWAMFLSWLFKLLFHFSEVLENFLFKVEILYKIQFFSLLAFQHDCFTDLWKHFFNILIFKGKKYIISFETTIMLTNDKIFVCIKKKNTI